MKDVKRSQTNTYRTVFGLGNKDIDGNGLECTPQDEADICLPSNLLESDGPGELIEEISCRHGKVGECHPLGPHFEAKDLNRIECLQRRESNRIDHPKHVNHRNGSFRGRRTLVQRILAGSDGHTNPDHTAGDVREEKKRSSPHFVDHRCTYEGKEKLRAV